MPRCLALYLADCRGSSERVERVLNQGLVTACGKALVAGRFAFLNTAGLSPVQVFEETLAMLFRTEFLLPVLSSLGT